MKKLTITKGLETIKTCMKNVEVHGTIELLSFYKKIVEGLDRFILDLKNESSSSYDDISLVIDVNDILEKISLVEKLRNDFVKKYNSLVKKIKKTKKELSSQTINTRKNKTIKEINELIKTI
jgi:hypothetical protein